MRKAALYFLLLMLLGLIIGCSSPGMVDGGSATDVGNPVAMGTVYDTDGSPKSDTRVQLLPADNNPIVNPDHPDSLLDTTDQFGRFSIAVSDSETQYTIQALHLTEGSRLLITGVTPTKDTTAQISGTLQIPGAARITFSDSTELTDGYVYVPGTVCYRRFSDPEVDILHENGKYTFVFDLLPAGDLPGFYFGVENSTEDPERFTDDFSVASNDTTIINAQMFWRAYNTANSDIPGNTVTAVAVGADGVRWIGTRTKGLASFDGVDWTKYDEKNSMLPHNKINALTIDSDGSIWIGTEDGLANLRDGNVWTIITPGAYTGLPSPVITALAVESNGIVWIGTQKGCAEYDDEEDEWTVYDTTTSLLRENHITGITINSENKKYITTYLGLAIYNDTVWATYYRGDDSCAIEDTIRGVEVSTDNTSYMATKQGVACFMRSEGSAFWFKIGNNVQGIDNENMASIGIGVNITADKWAGTVGDGTIYNLRSNYAHAYNGDNTDVLVNAGTIHCITSVANKTFYFGTENNGLIQLQLTVTWGR